MGEVVGKGLPAALAGQRSQTLPLRTERRALGCSGFSWGCQAAPKAHAGGWAPSGAAELSKPLALGWKSGEEEVEGKKGERCPRQVGFKK